MDSVRFLCWPSSGGCDVGRQIADRSRSQLGDKLVEVARGGAVAVGCKSSAEANHSPGVSGCDGTAAGCTGCGCDSTVTCGCDVAVTNVGDSERHPSRDVGTGESPLSATERADAIALRRLLGKALLAISLEQRRVTSEYRRSVVAEVGGQRRARESGQPLVWSQDFQLWVPLDDEASVLGDRIYSRTDMTVSRPSGEVEFIESITSRPRISRARDDEDIHSDEVDRLAVVRAAAWVARRAVAVDDLSVPESVGFAGGPSPRPLVDILVGVRDRGGVQRLPSRAQTRGGLSVSLTLLRELRAHRLRARIGIRRKWATDLVSWIRTHGGTVRSYFCRRVHAIRVSLPRDQVESLALHPDVARIELWPTSTPDDPGTAYACTGAPTRADASAPDTGSCLPLPDAAGQYFFEDARSTAINAWPYIDSHYDGAGPGAAGGLASWAELDEWYYGPVVDSLERDAAHLTLCVIDVQPDPHHVAFQSAFGDYRVRYFVDALGKYDYNAYVYRPEDMGSAPFAGDEPHGTSSAAVAMGSIVEGQDWRLSTDTARQARSGRARRALGVFSQALFLETAERIGTGDREVSGDAGDPWIDANVTQWQDFDGVDVITQSMTENSGTWFDTDGDGNDDEECPTNDQARGVTESACMVTWLFGEDNILYVKSAGNLHGSPGVASCPGSERFEIGDPGGSPAALPVGALGDTFSPNIAASAQITTAVNSLSAGDTTPDGRSYPPLVALQYACGVALAYTDISALGLMQYYQKYGMHTHTSSSAPLVAGAAILFKHWYMANHGADCANQPGRLMSNILNMADGYATDTRSSGGAPLFPPQPIWGLGRFRMRYFDTGHMSSSWLRSTKSITIEAGAAGEGIDLGDPDNGKIPKSARRLVVTLWWIEPNTGSGQAKCNVQAWLAVEDGLDAGYFEYRPANGDHKIRFQYDCYDTTGRFGSVPRGDTRLFIWADTFPTGQQYPSKASRTIYVSWYWESGPDLSVTQCSTAPTDNCKAESPMEAAPFYTGALAAALVAAQANLAARMADVRNIGPAAERAPSRGKDVRAEHQR